MSLSRKDVEFLVSLIPSSILNPIKHLDPTMYLTLSYSGDLAIKKQVETILKKVK